MSLKNTFLGAIIGAVVGGPVGAVVGGFAGYNSENISDFINDDKPLIDDDLKIVENIFTLLAKAAKIDGSINKEEVAEAYSILELFCENLSQKEAAEVTSRAKTSFNSAAKDNSAITSYTNNLRTGYDDDFRATMFALIVHICVSDGPINDKEISFLKMLKINLSISDDMYLQAIHLGTENGGRSEHSEGKNDHGGQGEGGEPKNVRDGPMSIQEAYTILGCHADSPIAEVKNNYRKKVSEYHPDKIQGKGLPPEFVVLANEQTKKINQAYEIIKRRFA